MKCDVLPTTPEGAIGMGRYPASESSNRDEDIRSETAASGRLFQKPPLDANAFLNTAESNFPVRTPREFELLLKIGEGLKMKSYFRNKVRGSAVLVILMFTVPSMAGADAGDHVLRLTLDYFEPTGSTYTWLNPEVIPGATSRIDTTPEGSFGFAIDYEYRFSGLLGVAVNLARTEAEMDITHYVAVQHPPQYTGDLAMLPLTVSPQFHLLKHEALDFYCGPLLGYVFYGDLKTEDYGRGAKSYRVENGFAYGALVGLDVPLGNSNWLFTSSVRYLQTRADIDEPYQHVEDMNAKIDIDPVVFQVGVGVGF